MPLTKYPSSLMKNTSVSKTANYTAVETDDIIYCDSSGAAFTITLPEAATFSGKILQIVKTDSTFATANNIIIDGSGSETINGALTTTLNTQYEALKITSNGTNWIILERYIPSIATVYSITVGATTTAPTKGATPSIDLATWKRIGDSAKIQYTLVNTNAGSAGTGTYLFPVPTGLTIDSAKIGFNTGSGVGNCGSGLSQTAGGLVQTGNAIVYNTTNISISVGSELNTPNVISSSFNGFNNAGAAYGFSVIVPIVGWNG